MKGTTLYSVIIFCQECYDNNRPKSGNAFVVVHENHLDVEIYELHTAQRGFTPHLVEFKWERGPLTTFFKACAMHGCGVSIHSTNEGNAFQWKKRIKIEMPSYQYQAMIKFGVNDPDFSLE